MKIKIAIIILVIACVGLGVALFATKKQSEEQHTTDVNAMLEFSNQLVGANSRVNELNQVNLSLTNDLAASQQQAEQLSNSLAAASASLENTRTSLISARDQIASLNTHISDLELQNKVLDQRANDLTNTIAQLSASIENTQNQLAIAETNRLFIEQQLQKQMAQKAELEPKFNDINEVRTQVKKLKDEMFIARRIQLMKTDNGSKQVAELLIHRIPAVSNTPAAPAYFFTSRNCSKSCRWSHS